MHIETPYEMSHQKTFLPKSSNKPKKNELALMEPTRTSPNCQSCDSASVPAVTRRPAIKVTGTRHKTKEPVNMGKKNTDKTDAAEAKVMKHGCLYGSANFSDADIWALLDAIANELPLGKHGWKAIQAAFNKHAQVHGHKQCSS
jgi:hypothetical protein